MDPNAALATIRALIAGWKIDGEIDCDSLAEHVDGLDGWITRGGFLPSAWQR
jgi:hypothetical protein